MCICWCVTEINYRMHGAMIKIVSQFIYFCMTLYMFQTGFRSIIRSSKLYILRQTVTATCC